VKEGVDYYAKLLGKYVDLKLIRAKEADNARLRPEKTMLIEGENLLGYLTGNAFSITLDAGGDSLSSEQLAMLLEGKKENYSRVQFFIGGAYGLSVAVIARTNKTLSLSKMTFPHELTQVILLEQLYRALSISAGSKYHK
jgi:23S rRNA (pseudouridine1915-N3)-methyltransferase